MGTKKRGKKWLLLAVLLIAAGGGTGVWLALQGGTEPVNVYPFMYVGMTEYWGDNQESYGPVTTDNIQTIFLSDTQTVTEIKVKAGDTVKKGDVLMTFDTTLDALALERKGVELEKMKLEWKDSIHELENVKDMTPMYIPDTPPKQPEPDYGVAWKEELRLTEEKGFDGSAKEKAIICWLSEEKSEISGDLLKEIWRFANAEPEPEETTEETTTETTEETTEETTTETTKETTEETTTETTVETTTETTTETTEEAGQPSSASGFPASLLIQDEPESVFTVIKVTQGDMSNSAKLVWQGIEIMSKDYGKTISFRFFDAFGMEDYTMVEVEEVEYDSGIYFGDGYTKQELAQMRDDLNKKIKEQEFNIRMAEAEYKLMQIEISDGNVYAQIDGEIVSVLTEEEAKQQRQPLIKLSGGGGFFVEGSVSELEKDKLMPGQEVTINDWNTGNTYTGQVREIGDFPVSDSGWNGLGNPNASYFPFRVFIDGEADLQEGSYVSVMYTTSGAEQGIYLENPFIRTEQDESYVMVMGADGRLEKRTVTLGKSLWGSYQEVLSGITEEDLIAFPYGKHVKAGAPAVESDISALYGY